MHLLWNPRDCLRLRLSEGVYTVAETYSLEAESRALVGKKVHQLRVKGLVPAVIYGARVEPINVQIPYRPLEVALLKAGGTHLINVNFDGKTQSVITRAV